MQPNILLITSDQQHWHTLGSNNPRIKTPALDALAASGTRYDRAYCNNPLSTPSRSTLITGLYPSTHHAWTLGTKLPEDVPTIGDLLQQQGYHTALIGKAHFQPVASTPDQVSIECPPHLRDLEFWRNFHGPFYGFKHIELARNHGDEYWAGQHYGIWLEEKGVKNWRDYFRKWPPDPDEPRRRHHWDLPQEYHYTTWTAERSIAQLELCAQDNKPFFLWSSFHDPHPPYVVPAPWDTMYDPQDMQPGTLEPGELDHATPWLRMTQEKSPDFTPYKEVPFANHGMHTHLPEQKTLRQDMAVYYGMISFMDQQIGRIMGALDRLGLAENTLVIFSTDHGHFLGQHGLTAKGPYHFEDLIRLPFIVRQPGRVPAGKTSTALQSLVDLAPSFLEYAGAPVPRAMQGVSQLGVWEGRQESARDHVLVENRHQPTKVHLRTYIEERYKMTIHRAYDWGELYDLQEDPDERHNRWDDPAFADIRAQLMHRFLQADMARERSRYDRIASA